MARLPSEESLITGFLTRTPYKTTQDNYRTQLSDFQRWARGQQIAHIAQTSTPHLHIYASHIDSQPLKHNTRARRLAVLRRFFDYLVSVNTIKLTPVPNGWVPKSVAPTPTPTLSSGDVAALYEASRSHKDPLDAGLLAALGGWDGVKYQHILALQASDVVLGPDGSASITVRHHDGTVHNRRMSSGSAAHLAEVVGLRPSGFLLYPDRVENRSRSGGRSRRALVTLAKAAGLPGRPTPNQLERSFRTRRIEEGIPVEVILQDLGLDPTKRTYRRQALLPRHGPSTEGQASRDLAVGELNALELLSQAERLCSKKGVTPIAPIVIAAAALEMVLRAMCAEAVTEQLPKHPGINAYAVALRRITYISSHDLAVIQANAQLRNAAAHGTTGPDISVAKAKGLIQDVRTFLESRKVVAQNPQ